MTARGAGSPRSRLPPHGALAYLQIPAADVATSARFYEHVFGWQVEPPAAGFEAPGLIGQWVGDRPGAPDGGLLAWIFVDHIDEALERARTHGGEVIEPPAPDGPVRVLAVIRDPGGNSIGIASHRRG